MAARNMQLQAPYNQHGSGDHMVRVTPLPTWLGSKNAKTAIPNQNNAKTAQTKAYHRNSDPL